MLLSYGGFCVKYWIIFGDVDEYFVGMNVLNVEQENIFGMCWLFKIDVWVFKVKLNFLLKRCGVYVEDDFIEG